MANTLHNSLTAADIHVAIRWTWANAAARAAQSIASADVGKVGLQSDTGATYVATSAGTGTVQPLGLKINTDGTGLTWTDNNTVPGALAISTLINTIGASLTPHADCLLATAAALPAGTYNNGSSGVGATFTVTATGTLTVDGVVTALNNRVLVKNQVDQTQNGVYKVTTAGAVGVQAVLTRDTDSDSGAALLNALYAVTSGTANANTSWSVTNATAPVIGTDAITFAQFQSGGTSGNGIKVGSGGSLTKQGNTLSRSALTGDVTAGADSNTTTVAGVAAATKVINAAKGANVAAANNLVLGADGNVFHITGSTQINLLASTNFQAGSTVRLIFDSTPLIKNAQTVSGANKPILLLGGVDWTPNANDTLTLTYDGTNWIDNRIGLLSSAGIVPINAQSGTTYTFALSDRGMLVTGSNGSATTFTIPANASVAFPVGTVINVLQTGAGVITVAITSDTLNAPNGTKCAKQGSMITLTKTASTTWYLSGDSSV